MISGGRTLPASSLTAVTDPKLLRMIPPTVHSMVRQVNLSALGFTTEDIGELGPHHYPGGNAQIDFFKFLPSGAAELFWNGVPYHRARFPNEDDDQLLIPQNSVLIEAVKQGTSPGHEVTRLVN